MTLNNFNASNTEEYLRILNDHIILKIEIKEISINWPRFVGRNSRMDNHGIGLKQNIIILETNKRAMGWGVVNHHEIKYSDEIIKKTIGLSVAELYDFTNGVAKPFDSLFDIAVHDLVGVILGVPVYNLLGQNDPIITKVYSGMIYFDDLLTDMNPGGIKRILEECQLDYNYGYRQFKLKIGRGNMWMPKEKGISRDIEVTRAVANTFKDCDIMVDANDGYPIEDLIQFLNGISDVKLYWIEEPFYENRELNINLKRWLAANNMDHILIADGEYKPDYDLVLDLSEQGYIDVFVADIVDFGFSNWRNLMPHLIKKKIAASPHAWGLNLKTFYTAHLAAAFGNIPTIEGVTCLSEDFDSNNYIVKNGFLFPPDKPGFGIDLLNF